MAPALTGILAACSTWRLAFGLYTKQVPAAPAVPVVPAVPALDFIPAVPVPLQCDVDASGAICFGSEDHQTVMLPPALAHGLVGFWSFDKSTPLDISGFGNHGMMPVQAGPSLGGQGSSAHFRRSFLTIPGDTASLYLQEFSIQFWVYLIDSGHTSLAPAAAPPVEGANGSTWCPLVRKGMDSRASFPADDGRAMYAAAPAILFDKESRTVRVELETRETPEGPSVAEYFESNARLSTGRWFHVALVHIDTERRTRLYINGILDASLGSQGFIKSNRQHLYVGGDPATLQVCDLPMYVDELKVYNRRLDPDEIQAEASPALAGVEPSFIRLACTNCSLEMAVENCPAAYHICSSLELHMGGYQVAHTMGWLQRGGHVWSHSPAATGGVAGQIGDHVSPGIAFIEKAPAPAAALAPPGLAYSPAPASAPASAPAQGPGLTAPAPAKYQMALKQTPGLGLGLCCADGA